MWKSKNKQKQYSREYYLKNKDRILKEHKKYHRKNREIRNSKQRLYSSKNREKIRSFNHKYYVKNMETLKLNQRLRTQKTRDNGTYSLNQRKYNLKKYHNLSLGDYKQMLKLQNGVCAICEIDQDCGTIKGKLIKKDFAVDHCHKTLEIRGLLCTKCNLGLGYFKDNILFLERAIKYLKPLK